LNAEYLFAIIIKSGITMTNKTKVSQTIILLGLLLRNVYIGKNIEQATTNGKDKAINNDLKSLLLMAV